MTKSTPFGSIDNPFNPPALVLGAHATFVARTIDRETKHMQAMLKRSYEHAGTSFLEVYQNCNIFNDGAYAPLTSKGIKGDHVLWLENGKPMVFGENNNKGIHLDGNVPSMVDLTDGNYSQDDLLVHDEKDYLIASLLSDMTYNPSFPDPIGVLYAVEKPTYEDLLFSQIDKAIEDRGKGSVNDLLTRGETWKVTD